jgi:hypothetical protein
MTNGQYAQMGVFDRYRFRAPLGGDYVARAQFSTLCRAMERLQDNKEIKFMKRVGNLFEKFISDANLGKAIKVVNASHRWAHYPDKPNKTVLWVESTKAERIKELRKLILDGFKLSPCDMKRRYDVNAGKWRDICEPKLYPDQYLHHALIQILEPVMMRGMDPWCCGSIKKRGAHHGVKAIKKWMKKDKSGTRWCTELDIYHFYDSVKPKYVMERMRRLIKDRRVLDFIWRVIKDGIKIGFYTSQWFMNTLLQPLDHKLRESGIGIKHSIRYMDNFTLFSNRKRSLDKAIKIIAEWLESKELKLKDNWQKFRTKNRLPNALGYRFGVGFTLIRKHSLLRLRRQLKQYYSKEKRGAFVTMKFAQGLLSRLGMLRHCNSRKIYEKYVKPRTQKKLKNIVKKFQRKEQEKWNTYLAQYGATA